MRNSVSKSLNLKGSVVSSYAVEYFGAEIVERAVANYFARYGVTEEVRDRLMIMEGQDGEEFFEMVSQFVENQGVK